MELTRIETVPEKPESPKKKAGSAIHAPSECAEPASSPEPTSGSSLPFETREAKPVSVEVLRRKLDAAIVAEAWDAVKAIGERIVQVECAQAGNVVPIDTAKRKGR